MIKPLRALLEARDIPYTENAPMAAHTTLRVGGPADLLVEARCAADVAGALRAAKETDTPVWVAGNGSNMLVLDGGIRGLVIVIAGRMADVEVRGTELLAQAGASMGRVAQAAQAAGLSGLEPLSGIPGTVGGAACMNAGCYGLEMSQVIAAIDVLDQGGNASQRRAEELGFGYRQSALMRDNLVATRVMLSLRPGERDEIAQEMGAFAARRREKQPLSLPSAGSFFKRPKGHFAGALIEQAGLKGLSVGGAQVSELHAGFLVNRGGATAKDFLDLMALVQARVYETSGVRLEPEVRILGCDSSC